MKYFLVFIIFLILINLNITAHSQPGTYINTQEASSQTANKVTSHVSSVVTHKLTANEPKPILEKSSAPGFVPIEFYYGEHCALYSDKVIVTKQFGSKKGDLTTLSRTIELQISSEIENIIAEARLEQIIETPNLLCDGPSTNIKARDLVLYSTGGCGSPKIERTGASTMQLHKIINEFCQLTH